MHPSHDAPDRYAVIGHPVTHSRSPWIHHRFAELTGQRLVYDRQEPPLDGFAQRLADLRAQGYRGCNVTVPFKFEAFGLATQHTPRAQLARACNTLRFDGDTVWGDNTDGVGLVRDITANAGTALAGQRLLLLGAGGAAAGVLGPLLAERPAELVLCNRTADKALALAQDHRSWADEHGCALRVCALGELDGAFDVVINATASSLGGGPVPVDGQRLRPGGLGVDLMYGPAAQPFLEWAEQAGGQGRDGLGMLVEQAAEAFAAWRGGVTPPAAQVLADLRAELAARPGGVPAGADTPPSSVARP